MKDRVSVVLTSLALLVLPATAAGFKFSQADAQDDAQDQQRQARVTGLLQTPCRSKIKNQKIMVLIGEEHNGRVSTQQAKYSAHFEAINARLQGLGLRTYTQAQIKAQVAQAEIDAYFKNDPDAAISASKKLAAQYILRGHISSQASYNAIVNVNQVQVRMAFTLTSAAGKTIAQANAQEASYAGQDTAGMALTLINEQAEEVVATLYNAYCTQSGVK